MNERILIFSENETSSLKLKFARSNLKVDFCSNTASLVTLINLHNYDSCLIDKIVIENGSYILEILKLLSKYNINIIIKDLSLPSEIKPDNSESRKYSDKEERLETVRRIAATLNHEINSPLMAISANVEMIGRQIGNNRSGESKIDDINEAIQKIRFSVARLTELDNIRLKKTPAGMMISLGDEVAGRKKKIKRALYLAE